MKKILFLLLVIFTITSNAQKKKRITFKTIIEQTDSLKVENKKIKEDFAEISRKLDQVLTENKELKNKNHQIEIQLSKHEAKEDFYGSDLSFYTVWFGIFISIITFGTGYITWRKFMNEVDSYNKSVNNTISDNYNNYKQLLEEHMDAVENELSILRNIKLDLTNSIGDVNVTISFLHFKDSKKVLGVLYLLLSINAKAENYLLKKEEQRGNESDQKFTKNIKTALKELKTAKNNFSKDERIAFKKNYSKLMEVLSELENKKLKESKNEIAEIRITVKYLSEKLS